MGIFSIKVGALKNYFFVLVLDDDTFYSVHLKKGSMNENYIFFIDTYSSQLHQIRQHSLLSCHTYGVEEYNKFCSSGIDGMCAGQGHIPEELWWIISKLRNKQDWNKAKPFLNLNKFCFNTISTLPR